MWQKLLMILMLAVSLGPNTTSAAATETPPATAPAAADGFVQRLGDHAIAILADKSYTDEQRNQEFRKMLAQSFDLATIGRFVIGRNAWQGATEAQKSAYLQLFEELIIKIYAERFALYSGEVFKVVAHRAEGDKDFMVKSEIQHPENPKAIQVDWRVRNFGDRLAIIDIIVEGISMSVTQRQEYTSVLQRNGGDLDELLALMRKQLDAPTTKG